MAYVNSYVNSGSNQVDFGALHFALRAELLSGAAVWHTTCFNFSNMQCSNFPVSERAGVTAEAVQVFQRRLQVGSGGDCGNICGM